MISLEEVQKNLVYKKIAMIAVVLTLLIPAVIMLYSVSQEGANIPYQDQWELITDFKKIDSGSYGVNDLWRQHNEHRLVFPRAIMLVSAYASSWNVKIEMYISIILAVIMLFLIYFILSKNKILSESKWVLFLMMLIFSVQIFSFNQAENWLWGWQLQWYLSIVGYLIVVWSLLRKEESYKWIIAAAAGAILATYSLGNGQIAWIAGGVILYAKERPLKQWIILSSIVLASYYFSLDRIGDPLGPREAISNIALPIKYFFIYLGHPLSNEIVYAFFAGLAGFIVYVGSLAKLFIYEKGSIRYKLNNLMLPILFAGFAIASAAATTISRTSLGIDQALSSRYVTVSNFFWIGLMIILVMVFSKVYRDKKTRRLVESNFMIAVLFLFIISSMSSRVFFDQHSGLIQLTEKCSTVSRPEDSCLRLTYPNLEIVKDRMEYLKNKGWAGY